MARGPRKTMRRTVTCGVYRLRAYLAIGSRHMGKVLEGIADVICGRL